MTLTASGLSKRFGQDQVLRDISFTAEPGKVIGIFGASGSGKTALLRVIAGKEKPDAGSLGLDGRDILKLDAKACGISFYEPEKGSFFGIFGSKADENLASGDARTEDTQKALLSDAKCILIDNGSASMDLLQKEKFFNTIREAAEQAGKIVVLASNNFEDILSCCDTVLVLHNGEVVRSGVPQEIYLEPSCCAAARITGRNNLFEARRLTSSKADMPEFQTLEGSHRLTVKKIEKKALGPLNQNVNLSIRPEHISISFGASFPEDNLIKAVITNVTFLGANTLVELDSDGLRLEALVLRLVGLKSGDECMLGLPPDRIEVFLN